MTQMQDRILSKTRVGQYATNPWDGTDRSGVIPIGDQILVLPDKVADKSAGGVYFADSTKSTQDIAAETGVIAAIGDGAWTWNMDRTRRFEGTKPKVGDRVCFTRYAGLEVIGNDDELYRLMSDNCIGGLRVEPEFETGDEGTGPVVAVWDDDGVVGDGVIDTSLAPFTVE